MSATSKRVKVRSRRNANKASDAKPVSPAPRHKKTTDQPQHGGTVHEGVFDPHKRAGFSNLQDRLIKNFGQKMKTFNRPWVHEHHTHSRGR